MKLMGRKEEIKKALQEVEGMIDNARYILKVFEKALDSILLEGEEPEDYLKGAFEHVYFNYASYTPSPLNGYYIEGEVGIGKVKSWAKFHVDFEIDSEDPHSLSVVRYWPARANGEWVQVEAEDIEALIKELEDLESKLWDKLYELEQLEEEMEMEEE